MSSSLKSVQAPIREFAKLINVNLATVVRSITLELFTAISERTPVDTGRARASWNVSEDTIDTTVPPEGTYTTNGTKPFPILTGRKRIFIVSNLDYIEPLENGHSEQAPVGMVQVAIAEMNAKYKLLVAKLKK